MAVGLNSFVKIPPAGGKSGGVLDIFFVEKILFYTTYLI